MKKERSRDTIYQGIRTPNDCQLWRKTPGQRWVRLPLAPSLKIWNHSPSGFEWGYLGSGPAQAALAILLDYTQDPEVARIYHQRFKADSIATAHRDKLLVYGFEIDSFLTESRIADMQRGSSHA